MKILRQILFASIMIIGFSIAASAQSGQDEKKDPPPKPKPPVIVVKPKDDDKPKEKPKDGNEKKPTAYLNGYSDNDLTVYG